MGRAFDEGMVMVLALWDDHSANMLWLDSNYPPAESASVPGVARGPCAITSGVPADVEAKSPDSSVTFSNIKFGNIGSTCDIELYHQEIGAALIWPDGVYKSNANLK